MADYPFREFEPGWQQFWKEQQIFSALLETEAAKPKYYVMDMFPYPSGSGLHVGHPLGYIATDIVAKYKKLQGFRVLHPMGFDAFGLPAENYAIETGTHPAITTEQNIGRYTAQLERLGLTYDLETAVRTSDPDYFKWTQWIFLKLFTSWYNPVSDKAESIDTLLALFSESGSNTLVAERENLRLFSAEEWQSFTEAEKMDILMDYRLAYLSETMVNWCPALGTILANDEIKEGVSERGGHPVERIPMLQWSLRITAYADRLLEGLTRIDWPEAVKEMQRNWIGKSEGAYIQFGIENQRDTQIKVFSTRPDTLFGVSFLALAPEHELSPLLLTAENKEKGLEYIHFSKNRSERERMADVKQVSGFFTGTYALHPLTQNPVPVYIADYVLGGYGTGAVMGVPAHDSRDHRFAKHFGLPILPVISGGTPETEAWESYEGTLLNSGEYNGLSVEKGSEAILKKLENLNCGSKKTSYRFRDANFSRQRYWGEPIPIVFRNGIAYPVSESELPVTLPEVTSYQPTGTGASPLAAITEWVQYQNDSTRETNTMPGNAGSSWYFMRYTDPANAAIFADPEKLKNWLPVDLYIGGAEHAVGHLLYSRFWTKFLFDLGMCPVDEPFQKLINQGMILGENGEKMSKSKGNVVNPDDLCEQYGADTFRMYEMFLGPLEQYKPWNTNGITGVFNFIKKTWNLYFNAENQLQLTEESPTPEELKLLHQAIKKVGEDIDRLSFNTSIPQFMITTNELGRMNCRKKAILEPYLILLAPFAPHLSEEIWKKLGHTNSIFTASWPAFNPQYLESDEDIYPVQINGKKKGELTLSKALSVAETEAAAMADPSVQKWLEGKTPKKIIVVHHRIINIVV